MTSSEDTSTVLAVVGPGRVGTCLHRTATGAGMRSTLLGRQDLRDGAWAGAGTVLLAVPDREIEPAARAMAASVTAAVNAAGDDSASVHEPTGALAAGKRPSGRLQLPARVGHTSGVTPLSALSCVAELGAATFSLHPLQTIPAGDASVAGAPCAVTAADPGTAEAAGGLARQLGMRPFELPEEARAAYHAAASIASNFLVALEESAAELLQAAGIAQGRELLAGLAEQSARNWREQGAGALTGPIARGDEETVASHLEAIAELRPELAGLYRALAERTREIAREAAAA